LDPYEAADVFDGVLARLDPGDRVLDPFHVAGDQAFRVRLFGDRLHLVALQPRVGFQHVSSSRDVRLRRRARVLNRVDVDRLVSAVPRRDVAVRVVRDEAERALEAHARLGAALELLLVGHQVFGLSAKIQRRCHAAEEHVARRDRVDVLDAVAVSLVPILVVGVSNRVHVDVGVDEARHHGHAARVDDPRPGRDRERVLRADSDDAIAVDQDERMWHGWPLVPVDEHAADESQRRLGRLGILVAAAVAPLSSLRTGSNRQEQHARQRHDRHAPASFCAHHRHDLQEKRHPSRRARCTRQRAEPARL
jgi:hypothetical protein